ncbi:MAG: efflux RND transporter periplasmic adaptor subunit [Thiogranum sp.]
MQRGTARVAFACCALAVLLLPLLTATQALGSGKPVVVASAALRELAPVNWYTGTVISRERAKLAAEVSGRLLWVAEVGQEVEEGATVARIDDALMQEDLAERRADIARIKAQLKFLEQEASRLQRLAKQNNAAQSQLEKTVSELAAARSELKAAQARERRTAQQLERTSLKAPFPGVVTERLLHAGEWADDGSAVIAMTDPELLEVQSWVSVSALPFIKNQSTLQLEINDKTYQGTVRTLVPVGDQRSRLYELRVSLPAQQWNVGESVRIAVPTALAREVLTVPRDALVIRRNSISLYRVDDDNIARQTSVRTGIASGAFIEVRGDVKAGDRVVVRGGERLRDGQQVTVQNQESMQ